MGPLTKRSRHVRFPLLRQDLQGDQRVWNTSLSSILFWDRFDLFFTLGKVKVSIHRLPAGWLFKYRLDPAPCRIQVLCLLPWTGKSANGTSNDSVSENDCRRGNSDSLTPLSYTRIDRRLSSHGVHFPNYTTHTRSDYMIGIHSLVFSSVCSAKTKYWRPQKDDREVQPFKHGAQTALFKDPVRTAL